MTTPAFHEEEPTVDFSQYPKSPVPADDFLIPGELPFTAFGQFGEGQMDKRVFEQDIYWVDIKGTPHLLEEMSEEYRINVIMFLRDGVNYFYTEAVLRFAATIACDALLGRQSGELIAHDLGLPNITDLTPQEWLESTPLMRKLHQLTEQAIS